jgi:hypothetical protein
VSAAINAEVLAAIIVDRLRDLEIERDDGTVDTVEAIHSIGEGAIALVIGGRIYGFQISGGDRVDE